MKAIILAAGTGSRLSKYTKDMPKCMLPFLGEPIIQRQVDLLRKYGVTDITVVGGYLLNKITIPNVKYLNNIDYATTNMVASFFLAREEFDDDILLVYGDILFERRVLKRLIDFKGGVGVVVDTAWRGYWRARHGSDKTDTESMKIDEDGSIISLGVPDPKNDEIDARYVGMIKFSKDVLKKVRQVYDQAREQFWDKPWYTSPSFRRGHMTDFLQALIDRGIEVSAVKISGGWLEFDTVDDYEKALAWAKDGNLVRFYNPNV